MKISKKPLRGKGILSREIGDETMLYNPGTGNIHMINKTAAFVWNLCTGSHTPEEMTNRLHDAYQVPGDSDVESDVKEILATFAQLGVLD